MTFEFLMKLIQMLLYKCKSYHLDFNLNGFSFQVVISWRQFKLSFVVLFPITCIHLLDTDRNRDSWIQLLYSIVGKHYQLQFHSLMHWKMGGAHTYFWENITLERAIALQMFHNAMIFLIIQNIFRSR